MSAGAGHDGKSGLVERLGEQPKLRHVVVDEQGAGAYVVYWRICRLCRRRVRRCCRVCDRQTQAERKAAAAAGRALCVERAPHLAQQLAADRESQSVARRCHVSRVGSASRRRKKGSQPRRRDALASVGDGQCQHHLQTAVFNLAFEAHDAVRGVAVGVRQQVLQHLGEALAIGQDGDLQCTAEVAFQPVALVLDGDPGVGGNLFQPGLQRDDGWRQAECACRAAHLVEQLLELAQHTQHALLDCGRAFAQAQARRAAREHAVVAQDGVERRAQVVAHPRQEVALGLLQFLRHAHPPGEIARSADHAQQDQRAGEEEEEGTQLHRFDPGQQPEVGELARGLGEQRQREREQHIAGHPLAPPDQEAQAQHGQVLHRRQRREHAHPVSVAEDRQHARRHAAPAQPAQRALPARHVRLQLKHQCHQLREAEDGQHGEQREPLRRLAERLRPQVGGEEVAARRLEAGHGQHQQPEPKVLALAQCNEGDQGQDGARDHASEDRGQRHLALASGLAVGLRLP